MAAKTYIAPIGHGLGDLIVSLPAVQWLIERGEETHLVLRSPHHRGVGEIIPGLAGWLKESELPKALRAGDRYVNLREHPLQTDYLWGSPEFEAKYPGYRIVDTVSHICRDFGIFADFKNLTSLPFAPVESIRGKVIFVPGSGGPFKCWPATRWVELKNRLNRQGLQVICVGEPEKSEAVGELLALGLDWIHTPTIKDALNAISSARAVVSVDTGLMHLALQQNVPVAAMWSDNPCSINFLRSLAHCFPVISPRCDQRCVSDELNRKLNLVTDWPEWVEYEPRNCRVSANSQCMDAISVDQLYEQVVKAINMAAVGISR